MTEVSNRTLSYIMVGAMFITILSTAATLTRLDMVQSQRVLTGFAISPNATAKLNISGSTSIVFRKGTIDWGTGFVNNSPMCNLTTVGIPGNLAGCGNFTNLGQPGALQLENNGNQNVNITLALNMTPKQWIGDGAARAWMNATDNASNPGACSTALQSSLAAVNTTPIDICGTLLYQDANDTIDLGMKVLIPSAAAPGQKVVSIIATATAV